jgi:hypothetical protein
MDAASNRALRLPSQHRSDMPRSTASSGRYASVGERWERWAGADDRCGWSLARRNELSNPPPTRWQTVPAAAGARQASAKRLTVAVVHPNIGLPRPNPECSFGVVGMAHDAESAQGSTAGHASRGAMARDGRVADRARTRWARHARGRHRRRWQDHQPLNRLEGIYAREGLDLAKSTLCTWHQTLAALVRPLVAAMLVDASGDPYLSEAADPARAAPVPAR